MNGQVNWDFKFDPPSIHEDDSCEACHSEHVSEGVVYKNATEWPAQFPCCVDELEEMKTDGRICMKHPTAYFEAANPKKGTPAYCEGCDTENHTGGVL